MAVIHQLDRRSGITYVYESKSYWDPVKKQSRSRRRLIGKLDPVSGNIISTDGSGKKKYPTPSSDKKTVMKETTADSTLYFWLEQHFSDSDHEIFTPLYFSSDDNIDLNPQERFALNSIRKVMHLYQVVDENSSRYSDNIGSLFSEEDFSVLKALDYSKLPLPIRAKIADFLWSEKKLSKEARIAVSSYLTLYNDWFSEDDLIDNLDIMHRVICITAQLNDKENLNKALDLLQNTLLRIPADHTFITNNILTVLIHRKHGDANLYLQMIQQILSDPDSSFPRKENALKLKNECLKWMKKNDEKEAILASAQFYENEANSIHAQDFQSLSRKAACLLEAIKCLNNPKVSKNQEEKRTKLEKELASVSKESLKYISCNDFTINIVDFRPKLVHSFEKLTFRQAIVHLCQFVIFRNTEELLTDLKKRIHELPYTSLAAFTDIIDHSGHVVGRLPYLDIFNPESDPDVLHLHLLRQCDRKAELDGTIILPEILKLIRENHTFTEADLNFLVRNNPIIPPGREGIFASGICLALNGKYYEALHILAPQMEHLFRTLASELDGWTTYVDSKALTKRKTLEHIFHLPEFKDSIDNRYSLTFESLLTSSVGGNIRNKIAHGLMDESAAQSGNSVYFICAVIAYLALTSEQAYRIYQSIKKSK